MDLCMRDRTFNQVEEEGIELTLIVLSKPVVGEKTGDRHGN